MQGWFDETHEAVSPSVFGLHIAMATLSHDALAKACDLEKLAWKLMPPIIKSFLTPVLLVARAIIKVNECSIE